MGQFDELHYEKIKQILETMSITYRGGILAHMIKLSRSFFKDKESLKVFIDRVLSEIE